MGRKLLKTVQTITTFRNPIADPMGTRRGPPLVRGPQFENRCPTLGTACNALRNTQSLRVFRFIVRSPLRRVCVAGRVTGHIRFATDVSPKRPPVDG